jgi:hypothetical protein
MRYRARPGVPVIGAEPGTSSAAAGRRTALRLTAAMLVAAAALDLTRCSLVLMTSRHVASTVALVTAGIGAAVVSMTAARGYRAGRRWAAWAALVIGIASAPQASASGFRAPFSIPDAATAVLGILLTVAVLAVYGRPLQSPDHPEIPWDMAWPADSVVGGAVGQRQNRSAHPARAQHPGWHRPASRPDRNPLISLDRSRRP